MQPKEYRYSKPTWEDLDPDSGELWLWEEWNRCWRLGDESWCEDSTWWLPFYTICDPNYQKFEAEYKKNKKQQSEEADKPEDFGGNTFTLRA